MLSRTIRRSILDTRIPFAALPPTFLLPLRARYFNSTSQHVEPPADDFNAPQESSATPSKPLAPAPSAPFAPKQTRRSVPQPPPEPSTPLALSSSIKELLPLLSIQPGGHYISIHIHGKPYLVTVGDMVRLPFHMPGVVPGDVLRLNKASSLGSRDYTLKGTPYLDDRIFECRATVMGTESEPMRLKTKTKRRNRKIKTVRSKHKSTMLCISELKIKTLEELGA